MSDRDQEIELLKLIIDEKKSIAENITALEIALQEYHDASQHPFTLSGNIKVCSVCGWIHPDQPAGCGHHTLREHAQGLLEALKTARKIEAGEIQPFMVIEMTVESRPRRWWPF